MMVKTRLFIPLVALTVVTGLVMQNRGRSAPHANAGLRSVQSPSQIPSPGLINFDDLANAAVIGDSYGPDFGVHFENSAATPRSSTVTSRRRRIHYLTSPSMTRYFPAPALVCRCASRSMRLRATQVSTLGMVIPSVRWP